MRDVKTILSWIESGPAKCVAFSICFENDWTVTRHGHLMDYRVVLRSKPLANFDLFLTNDGVLPALRSLIAFGIRRIELLDVEVLHVRPHVREAPSDPIVVANYHAWDSRRGDARNAHTGRAQVDHVPDRRRTGTQMRIVCEQWFAGYGSIATDDPVIAGGERVRIQPDAFQRGRGHRLVLRECGQCSGRDWIEARG